MNQVTPAAQPFRLPVDGMSLVVGDKGTQPWSRTIPEVLSGTVKTYPDEPAVVYREQGVRWSWREFEEQVDRCAAGLRSLGLEKGDRVGIWAPNRVEWLVTQFATARLGLILVNINPAYRLSELEYALNKVECKALVSAAVFKTSEYLEMIRTLAPEIDNCAPGDLRSEKLPHLRSVIRMGEEKTPGMYNYQDVLNRVSSVDRGALDAISASLSPHDPINIQFTSGTTGLPKGATLTHYNLVNNAHSVVSTMRFTHEDTLCIPVPLYHCFGMSMGTLGCVTKGATMVFAGEAFEPEQTLAAVSEEGCTALYGVPTMFVAMLTHPDLSSFNFSALRTGIMAGAPCPVEVMNRVLDEMQMTEVTIAYGMTETSPVSFQSDVDDPIEKRVGTVGRVLPNLEVKILDSAGNIVPVGESGELCTRGYSVMQGYWGEEARTRESIDADGWMHSGDLATIDAQGFCNIVGRVKDMLIRGGENVYPREIEEYLFRHPKIQEVQVFGVPDERFGEEICAWVVLTGGEQADEEEIKAFCRGQIAHFKIPRYVRFVSELPMTVTGKPQKFKMREAMLDELGLEEVTTA